MKSSSPTELPDRPPLPTTGPETGEVEQRAGGAPVLARIADAADARDRLAAQIAVDLVTAMDADVVTAETRLSTQVWLENVVRFTAAEARRLLGLVTVLRHLPATLAGLRDGRLSWAQVQQLCAAAKTIPVARRVELDALIGGALDEYRTYHPDELCDRVWQVCDTWQPTRLEKMEQAAERGEHLCLSPNVFGGGSLYAELSTANFATACEALDAPLTPPSTADVDLDDPDQVEAALDDLDAQRRALARQHGADLAARFVQICEDALAGRTADGQRIAPRPTAYVVTTADALCDADRTPGWLLTTLTGGTLKASTSLIQRLVDERGADVRGIVLDDLGQLVGVGRTRRHPPQWLREALWATWLTDQAPGGTTPVRRCDLDHLVAWDDGGPTDAANLQPIGRRAHTRKTDRRWTVTRARDGTTTWTHRHTGMHVTRPPTWRELGTDPPERGPLRLPLNDLDDPEPDDPPDDDLTTAA